MKIVIKADGHNIRLWFPLSILKSRLGYSVAKSSIEHNKSKYIDKYTQQQAEEQDLQAVEVVANTQAEAEQIKQEIEKEISLTREQMVEVCNILKRCVKEHGHFNLIEVDSHEGEKVIIRV